MLITLKSESRNVKVLQNEDCLRCSKFGNWKFRGGIPSIDSGGNFREGKT